MGTIKIKDMQIRVRKESDNSEGWIRMEQLVDTIADEIIESLKSNKKE